MDTELVKEIKFRFLNKLVIISEIPVQGDEDNFKVTNVVSMPEDSSRNFIPI